MKKQLTNIPDKSYSLKELLAVIKRNDDAFVHKVLTYAVSLEKATKK